MTEFYKKDLSGSRFEEIDFTNVRMRNVYFVDALIRARGWRTSTSTARSAASP